MFPVKFGNEEDVALYSSILVDGEKQLLITSIGNMYITTGDGNYVSCNGNNAVSDIEELKKEIDSSINNLFIEIDKNFIKNTFNFKDDIELNIVDKNVSTVMSLQESLNYIIKRLNDNEKIKCGTFKVGSKKCGSGDVVKATCGTFKAGQFKVGQGIAKKAICGIFRAGNTKVGS